MSRTLIIYHSYHHKNTEKVARHLAEKLGYSIYSLRELAEIAWSDYDQIILGSGIYYQKLHKKISNLIERQAAQWQCLKIYGLITSGMRSAKYRHLFVREIEAHGLSCEGVFHCKGWDTFGPLKLFGGIAKNRPNDKDLAKSVEYFRQKIG